MSDPPSLQPASPVPVAAVHTSRIPPVIWLIPFVALLLAGYLGWQALSSRGPMITVIWRTADGLQAGQTKVKHRAVELGTVERITLTEDKAKVQVQIRMRREAEALLTDRAKLWVVRPRFTSGNVSGLDTLVSGAFIELDPGAEHSTIARLMFEGLEDPPAIRSNEPGTTFTLQADRIGSLSSGSPLFFRDIAAGEVLSYALDPVDHRVTIKAFVHTPYDGFVRRGTRFWNASGVAVELGARGVRLKIASVAALLNGGVAFDTPPDQRDGPRPAGETVFPLYADENVAASAGYHERVKLVTHLEGNVRGLARGSPVELFGIQIGEVTDVLLDFDPGGKSSRVTVRFEVQPERMAQMSVEKLNDSDNMSVASALVARGLRMQLTTVSFLTGQQALGVTFVPGAPMVPVVMEGDSILLPSQAGGFDDIISAASTFVAKLNALPLERIGAGLDETLAGASKIANGPELREALKNLNETLVAARETARSLQAGIAPVAKKLPELMQTAQSALDRANGLIKSIDAGYGGESRFNRDLGRLLGQVGDAVRSMRLLADYLEAHPEALLRGRAGDAKQ